MAQIRSCTSSASRYPGATQNRAARTVLHPRLVQSLSGWRSTSSWLRTLHPECSIHNGGNAGHSLLSAPSGEGCPDDVMPRVTCGRDAPRERPEVVPPGRMRPDSVGRAGRYFTSGRGQRMRGMLPRARLKSGFGPGLFRSLSRFEPAAWQRHQVSRRPYVDQRTMSTGECP